MSDTTWRQRGACHRRTGTMFPGDETNPATLAAAKAVCATCPVVPECREAGRGEPYGVWGGETASERYTRDPSGFSATPTTINRRLLRKKRTA